MQDLPSPFTVFDQVPADRRARARPPRPAVCAAGMLAVLLPLVGASVQAGTLIDTRPGARSYIYPFGETDTTTYGQTFVTPDTDTRLDSFTFFLRHTSGGPVRFRAYVYEWDEAGGHLQGEALYASGGRKVLPGQGQFQPVTIRTQGVELEPGRDYVAFFSAARLFDGVGDQSDWLSVGGDAYQGGHFVFHNSAGRFPGGQTRWDCGSGCSWQGAGSDVAFRMTFNMPPVPEPSTVALMLAGLGVVGTVARRRRPAAG